MFSSRTPRNPLATFKGIWVRSRPATDGHRHAHLSHSAQPLGSAGDIPFPHNCNFFFWQITMSLP